MVIREAAVVVVVQVEVLAVIITPRTAAHHKPFRRSRLAPEGVQRLRPTSYRLAFGNPHRSPSLSSLRL
jgi:hypothetical protein